MHVFRGLSQIIPWTVAMHVFRGLSQIIRYHFFFANFVIFNVRFFLTFNVATIVLWKVPFTCIIPP